MSRNIAVPLLIGCVVGVQPSAYCAEKVNFPRDIAPILKKHCWSCHGAKTQRSSLRLDRRASMLKGGDYGLPAVVPGKPEKSYLIQVVKHLDPDLKMPPEKAKLPAKEIALLTRWIKEGAVVPGQMQAAETKKTSHWSFQPIARPKVPTIKSQPHNPIDAFLMQRLATKGLTVSRSADPRSLIRRASIVLTGLPPTPTEAVDFVAAYRKDPETAYARLVDRLLSSKHFGERWAQHWLDVIRWAETNGSESNMYRKNAWIYRDYVIRAFNSDKPYDRFVIEQIAGDRLGQGDATGFLVSGPHVPAATVGQEPAAQRQARADRMDEVLQTVGASVMGLTIGCARCHNHKFDPISISDYYAMSAVFGDVEFGSRFPELSETHPRRIRGKQLFAQINRLRRKLQNTGPWEEHWTGFREVRFTPTTTKSVRISFLGKAAFIDELEIFGTKVRRRNLARASEGTRTKSPPNMAVPRKDLKNINDGRYGTQQWAARARPGAKDRPWVQFTFTEPHEVNRIRLSSNREDFLETDYLLKLNTGYVTPYRIEVQTQDGRWKPVAATPQFRQLNKKHRDRAASMGQLQKLIQQVNEEGPKPSFVARFVKPGKTRVLMRGSPENPRNEVFAAGLRELDGTLDVKPDAPGWQRRGAFARWLTNAKHPLTARVAANRLWHHVFGRGLVATTSDFGAAGTRPTHPQLLDWLAAELMQPAAGRRDKQPARWSMKHLIRLMVTSRAFRQSSRPRKDGLAADAGSALLWRFPPKRVEAEVLRDAILQASGSLDRRLGGRSYRIHNVKKRYAQWKVVDNFGPSTWRRMIYQERMRRVDDGLFTAFDFPDCGQVRAKRPVSTTPLQSLNLLNSKFVIDQSKRVAARAVKESPNNTGGAVKRCFQLLLSRGPSDDELKECLKLAQSHDLSLVCRALINSNEFAFLP